MASPTGYWANIPKFLVSYLKSMYGSAATAENDFGYDWHPTERYGVTLGAWQRPRRLSHVVGRRHDEQWPEPEHDDGHDHSMSHRVLPPFSGSRGDPVRQGDGSAPAIH